MANIDDIIKEIIAQAEETAKENIAEAKSEAAKIKEAADAECKKLNEELAAKSEASKKASSDRAKSSAEQQKRQAILKAKQEIISSFLDKAYGEILAMDDTSYFTLIEKLIKKYSLPKDGEIFFSKKDLERLPSGFDKKAADIAKENGGSLKVSSEAKNIDGGFVLSYGGIEENCSIAALFHSNKEVLADKVHELLFS